jgi:hypothetical protein
MLVVEHHTHYMWVRLLKSKDDSCTKLENIVLDMRHLHARHHSQSGAFAPVIKFDSDYVFEAAPTRQMCAHMGVGVQYSPPYAHHMPSKAERSWRTIRDNASSMLHSMAVPNFMWSCVVSTVVCLQSLVRPYRRRSTHSPYVVIARRLQILRLRMHRLRQGARQVAP